jgi:hypothetical protein
VESSMPPLMNLPSRGESTEKLIRNALEVK